jgi:hypothetical protein
MLEIKKMWTYSSLPSIHSYHHSMPSRKCVFSLLFHGALVLKNVFLPFRFNDNTYIRTLRSKKMGGNSLH